MNKGAIKSFAIWARNKLMADVKSNAYLIGIREDGIQDPLPQSTSEIEYYDIGSAEPYVVTGDNLKKRNKIISRLQYDINDSDYKTAYRNLLEHTASTWFNRLCAIRFMEVNEYFDDGLRVLSSVEEGKRESDLMSSPFESDIEFTDVERIQIREWKIDNKSEDLFTFLLKKKCIQLSDFLPGLFEAEDDYIDLLVRLSIIDKEGLINHLVNDIVEDDWREQVQIIGWLYQFYITEKHEEVINPIHGKEISKEDIPAATQLFTTDWVVRYLLDNSLGRYWIERHPESLLAEKLPYYIVPKDGNVHIINERIQPEELKVLDPCVGSGHFLAYAFDILMEIYRECGWIDRDAARSIIENNLYGIDIDERASQLAYFSLMMKAREYNRHIINGDTKLNILAMQDSTLISKELIRFVSNQDLSIENDLNILKKLFDNAKELGSIIDVPQVGFKAINDRINEINSLNAGTLIEMALQTEVTDVLLPIIKQAEILAGKYDIVATNPPYMNKYSARLKAYIGDNYEPYKGDLFSVFMYRNFGFCKPNGYSGFMTPNVWMFIKSYEALRKYVITQKSIITLIQMAKGAFFKEATVDVCAFVLGNTLESQQGMYFRLEDFRGDMEVQRVKVEEAIHNRSCGYYYETDESYFSKIAGSPIAYWLNANTFNIFENESIGKIIKPKVGLQTNDNEKFLRLWFEVSLPNICFNAKSIEEAEKGGKRWFPYNKGGQYRKWYGNADYVLNWENGGKAIKNTKGSVIRNPSSYFLPHIAWSDVTSGDISFRYFEKGFAFDACVNAIPVERGNFSYLLGFLNTKQVNSWTKVLNPTIHFKTSDFQKLPYIQLDKPIIDEIVNQCIELSKLEWNSFETSWGFVRHPLISVISRNSSTVLDSTKRSLAECFASWKLKCDQRFDQLKYNEEELNRLFMEIYGLQDELTPDVTDEEVTVRRANITRDIKSFISYAVGCMFGRYSLDAEGLAYAGGDWKEAWENKYESFIPDEDNCIPITDENYFSDDVVGRFVEFIRVVYGDDKLEENLQFIADAIGGKGDDSRDVIRRYFLYDFFKDHCKTYSVSGAGKRPIYWLFDSGKQNGFKALVYMHRWDANTIATVRTRYVFKVQEKYENELRSIDLQMEHLTDPRQKASLLKRKEKITKQVVEIRKYDELIGHMALEYIDIDLDDGVKVNHEKVQIDRNGDKYQILAPIK